jgi:hypothetical protein
MAYPIPSAQRRRPASVVAGVVLLVLAIVALVVLAIAQFLIIAPVGEAIEAAGTGTPDEGSGTLFAGVLFGGGGGLNALSAIVLAVLAGFDLAGKQPARVMTWIVAPLSALCCGCASAIYTEYLFLAAGQSPSTAGQELSAEQTAAIGEGMPDWYSPAALGAVGLLWIGVLGAIIALAVPSANEYFRKREQTWLPAYGPPPGYPTEGYPPGYPPPGYPPQQPYPPQWPPTGPQQ